eukprot:CAMPEP_0185773104 /NCGR_PEP_ID=MMETSP1174-20130828/72294_1 /TAXON_ID=35687 /ORGANISM="Dictyocha speculum, Strain CCMP1381" /LENGTH=125 /DNA_ID=CAMNT_0028459653 /DNA_START=260 /DNA_END=634 /DNA_ORIENTATION=-
MNITGYGLNAEFASAPCARSSFLSFSFIELLTPDSARALMIASSSLSYSDSSRSASTFVSSDIFRMGLRRGNMCGEVLRFSKHGRVADRMLKARLSAMRVIATTVKKVFMFLLDNVIMEVEGKKS